MTTSLTGGGTTNLDALSVAGAADFGTPTYSGVAMGRMVLGTAQNTTSGTSIDFTGIPSWVKRVTLMFNQVSTSGVSNPLVQLGAGSVTTSGYLVTSTLIGSANTAYTAGFGFPSAAAVNIFYGHMVFTLMGSNLWAGSICMGLNQSGTAFGIEGAGNITLSGALDRIRLTTVNGTDTFDAGSVNILYEG
jgi:hypothetical protein